MNVMGVRIAASVLVASGVAMLAFGCSSASEGPNGGVEKTGSSSAALIPSTYTPPPFPNGYRYIPSSFAPGYYEQNCVGYPTFTIAAIPHSDSKACGCWSTNGAACPSGEACTNDSGYTRYTSSGEPSGACATGDVACENLADLFSIPSTHGFRYLVKQLTLDGGTGTCTSPIGPDQTRCFTGSTSGNQYFFQGLANWNKPWEALPWYGLGQPFPSVTSDTHPPYGTDYESADWKQLYNLVSVPGYEVWPVDARSRVCVAVYAPAVTTLGNGTRTVGYGLIDFFAAGEEYDPSGQNW